jgi:hypothetical protein
MKTFRKFVFVLVFFFIACQPNTQTLTVIDGENIFPIQSSQHVPLLILSEADISIQPTDKVFANGVLIPLDETINVTYKWSINPNIGYDRCRCAI